MCLYVDEQLHKKTCNGFKPHTARKNITVWKVIKKNNYSLYLNKCYKQNILYPRVKFGYSGRYSSSFSDIKEFATIDRGYHSYRSRERARDEHHNVQHNNSKIVKFIIPKGAKYYIGDCEDIVSDIIKSGDLKHSH